MRFREFNLLHEYIDPLDAKKVILKRVKEIDPNEEANEKLLDRIYTIIDRPGVTDRFLPKIEPHLEQEYKAKTIADIAERIVSSSRLNLTQKNKFLDNLAKNRCVNSELLVKSGHYNLMDLFYGEETNFQMFMEFLDWGVGKQRAGKGEHALAILSKNIQQQGKGDIQVGDKAVELKVAAGKGSGRLGERGVSPNVAKDIIGKFEELTDALNNYSVGGHDTGDEVIKSRGKPDKPQKSINVFDFVRIVNSLKLTKARRNEIGKAIFSNAFGKHGDKITEVFSTPGASPQAVLDAYIAANFDWYKENPDSGGEWGHLVSMSIGTMSFIIATNGEDLANLNAQGAIARSVPYIIPTQAPEIFFQVNPTAK